MANSYTQLYIQIVFPVKYRARLISPIWKERLHRYITGIVQGKGHKMLQIHCMPDHAHIFIGMNPSEALSDLVRDIKKDSSAFINNKGLVQGRFAWQEGFGAFSYSHDDIPRVIHYIQNQEYHHKEKSFQQEYVKFLEEFHVDFKPDYIFEPPISE